MSYVDVMHWALFAYLTVGALFGGWAWTKYGREERDRFSELATALVFAVLWAPIMLDAWLSTDEE